MRRSSVRSPEPLLTCRLVSRRGAEDPSRAAAAHARGGGRMHRRERPAGAAVRRRREQTVTSVERRGGARRGVAGRRASGVRAPRQCLTGEIYFTRLVLLGHDLAPHPEGPRGAGDACFPGGRAPAERPSPGVRRPDPDRAVLGRPTPAPGNPGHSLCAPGRAAEGGGAAGLPIPGRRTASPLRGLGSDRRRPVSGGARGRLCRKPKVAAGRKDSARRPASSRLRQSAGGCRARPIRRGCSAGPLPPRRGRGRADPPRPSWAAGRAPAGRLEADPALRLGERAVTSRH